MTRRSIAALTAVVFVAGSSPALAATTTAEPSRQQAFARAATAYHVPESVLLGVSYLESRWDANAGRPSTSGGYGPMDLIDATLVPPASAGDAAGDPRGDTSRPLRPVRTSSPTGRTPRANNTASVASTPSLQEAAKLTGLTADRLRNDAAANISGGAALLATAQRALKRPLSGDPAKWYGAVAKFAGGNTWFADQVYDTIRAGAARMTDDGQRVGLPAAPSVKPDGAPAAQSPAECPRDLRCEWIPAPYQQLDPKDPTNYGNHDLANRPKSQRISYIIIHDTEETYASTIKEIQDPRSVSWNYTIRSADGHVAQHVKAKDVAWHAGNWYVNSKAIGIEHEGFLAQGGTWYTEAMYRSSAELVRYLAHRYGIPLDRAHILGHDNVPGTTPSGVQGMHVDPGPYWDWAHYFDLLGAPLRSAGRQQTGLVMIRPDYATNKVSYTGCDAKRPADPCPAHGGSAVMLRTAPSPGAPLVKDIGMHPPTGDATTDVADPGARAATGQVFAVAGRQGDWTAIWYLGQKAWFSDPAAARTSVPAHGIIVTPRPGLASVPVYGRAYPEAAAYPAGVPVQDLVPMQYPLAAGQRYSLGGVYQGEYYYSNTFDTAGHVVVRGKLLYYQIQFGHRVYYVKTSDVALIPAR